MSLGFTRRSFLAGLAAGIAGAALGLRLYLSGGGASREAARLAGMLPHAQSAARLGRLYLEGAPQEADAARLVALINAAPAPTDTDEALRAKLDARIRDDFINNDLVAVDGWLLSRTEARLCALVSLLHNADAGIRRAMEGLPLVRSC
jgi:hypothetical protein